MRKFIKYLLLLGLLSCEYNNYPLEVEPDVMGRTTAQVKNMLGLPNYQVSMGLEGIIYEKYVYYAKFVGSQYGYKRIYDDFRCFVVYFSDDKCYNYFYSDRNSCKITVRGPK